MRGLIGRFMKRIDNLPLVRKMHFLVLIGVVIMSIVSLLVTHIVNNSYQDLLYQALTESVSYSSEEIVDYMADMENLTMLILADENIQAEMTVLKEESLDSLVAMNAVQRMRSDVGGYYQSFSDGILGYITLYATNSTAYTNILRADETPKEIQQQIIYAAEEKDGGVCWVTDYVGQYGLFLARNINKINSIKLESLGTVLINIDMNKLISDVTKFGNQYDETAYVISQGDQIFFYTENLSEEDAEKVRKSNIDRYEILKLNRHDYFVVHGSIDEYEWDYYCLVSYDQIAEKISRMKLLSSCIVIAIVLLVIYLSGRLLDSLMKHFKNLIDKMQQFAADNTKIPEVTYDYSERKDELGTLHRQFDLMSETITALINENYINEILKKEAQLKSLEHQINPHFLYNALGSINWRAKAIGAKDISDMVEALSVLLRTSLNNKDDNSFNVGKEMEVIYSYITIQKLRYEDRLNFQNCINEIYYMVNIPKLIIQPLVENAIYYGLESNVEECTIILSAEVKSHVLYIYVKNTGSEIEEDLLKKLQSEEMKSHGNGIGLLNIDKRIKIRFGEDYGLSFYNENEYAVVVLTIPIEKTEKEIV